MASRLPPPCLEVRTSHINIRDHCKYLESLIENMQKCIDEVELLVHTPDILALEIQFKALEGHKHAKLFTDKIASLKQERERLLMVTVNSVEVADKMEKKVEQFITEHHKKCARMLAGDERRASRKHDERRASHSHKSSTIYYTEPDVDLVANSNVNTKDDMASAYIFF